MAYLNNIPQSTDKLSTSQGQILGNFQALGSVAGNGNASSNSLNATSGFNWVYLPVQGATPPAGASFPAANIGVYSAASTISSKNELYVNKTNQATVVQIPITGSILSASSTPANGSDGWTYLPSGILIKWGIQALTAGGSPKTITFPTSANIPVFSRIFNIQLTQYYTGSNTTTQVTAPFAVYSYGATNFVMTYSGTANTSTSVAWMAIGIPTSY